MTHFTNSWKRFSRSHLLLLLGLIALSSAHHFIGGSISVAYPSIRAEFDIGEGQLAWVATARLLPYMIFMPIIGRLADLHGRKRVLLAGLGLFILGTIACATLPSFWGLLFGRVFQGIGAAGVNPLSMAVMVSTFPSDAMGSLMGIWQASGPIVRVLGTGSTGWLIEISGWRLSFWITVVLGLLGVLLVYCWIPDSEHQTSPVRFDWLGTTTLSFGLALPLIATTTLTWDEPNYNTSFMLFAGGFLGLLAFWFIEKGIVPSSHQLLRPSLLANRRFAAVSLLGALRMSVGEASFFVLPLLMVEVLDIRVGYVGLVLALGKLFTAIGTMLGGALGDNHGLNRPNILGMIILAVSLFMLVNFDSITSLLYLIIATALQGFGSGLSLISQHRLAGSTFTDTEAGAGFGAYNAFRFFGAAAGPILAGTVLELSKSSALSDLQSEITAYISVYQILVGLTILAVISALLISRWSDPNLKPDYGTDDAN